MLFYTVISISQNFQRYKTVGDWQRTNLDMVIKATDLPNEDMTFLIAVHELVEAYLCERAGVTQEQVDEFDLSFDPENSAGIEPGDAETSPYRLQHQAAESIERHLAQILGVDWNLYQREVDRALEGK